MPITFIYPDNIGGVSTYVDNLASFLAGKNIPYKIMVYSNHDSIKSIILRFKQGPGILLKIYFSQYSTRLSNYKTLRDCITKDDILVCSDSLEIAAINKFRLKNRIIFIFHGDLTHYYKIVELYQHILDAVFCVSKGLVERNKKKHPRLVTRLAYPLVRNGVLKDQIGGHQPLRVVFVSRLSRHKGADALLQVIRQLKENQCEIRWEIVSTHYGCEDNLLEQLKLHAPIQFDLANEAVLNIIQESDILFFPSRSEGFGIVVLESMKRGVVPIVNDLPFGIPDMIRNKETGLIVNVDNISQIVNQIKYLIANRTELSLLSRQAFAFSNNTFDFDKLGETFIKNVSIIETKKNKSFDNEHEFSFKEKYIPEYLYRIIKMIASQVVKKKIIQTTLS